MTQSDVRICFAFDVDGHSLVEAKSRLGFRCRPGMIRAMEDDQSRCLDRALSFYEEVGHAQTLFVTGRVAETEPLRIARALQAGHEIAFHGYSHMPFTKLTAEEESEEFRITSALLHDRFNWQLKGMRAPSYGFSAFSPRNMLRTGMIYDSSQLGSFHPSYMPVAGAERGYWEIPSVAELDDWSHCVFFPELGYERPLKEPSDVLAIYKACFDRCYAQRGCFVTVWHPFATMGDAYRHIPYEMLAYIRRHKDVRFCTMVEIATSLEADRRAHALT